MYAALSPGAIGVSIDDLGELLEAAKRNGFLGVEISPAKIVASGEQFVRNSFESRGMLPAGWGLPTDWRSTEDNWKKGLEALPDQASAAASIGCTRTFTWIMPGSNDRETAENRRFHIERFKPIAAILAGNGCSLGLEFIGPKTLRDTLKHPFVYRMQDMLELAREIGPNVGLLLDCWHWYTSGGTVEDISKLKADDVVYAHVNDAPLGLHVDQQVDSRRELPGQTGVIDIAGFLRALRGIGYEGPVVPEPFKNELNDLPSDEARLQAVASAMRKVLREAE